MTDCSFLKLVLVVFQMTNKVKGQIFSDKLVAEVLIRIDPLFFPFSVPQQFKEISFAYEVLSNPEKKELYDRYGEQGLREGGGCGPGMDDIFSHIFGGGLFGFMGGHGSRSRNGGRRRGEDMVHPLKYELTLQPFLHTYCNFTSLLTSQQGPEAVCKMSD